MKTIAAILPNFFGGGEKITSTLSKAFVSRGYRVILVTDPQWVIGREDSLGKIYSGIITLPLVGAHFNLTTTRRVSDAIRGLKADVLWMIGDDFDDIPTLRDTLSENGKIIFQLHSVPYYQIAMKTNTPLKRIREKLFKNYSRRYRRRMQQTLANVDNMIVLCDGYAEQLKNEFPEFASKIVSIRNPAPDVVESKKTTETIAYVGRLTRSDKRVDNLLRVISMTKPWEWGWKVRIIGSGPEQGSLEKMAEDLGLQQVEFVGYQSQPDLAGAQIICLTSDFEGWPTALIEGMQQGAVPIAFGCSAGVKEILADGRGVEVAPGDLEGYADALRELMASPERRREMTARAQSFLESLNIDNIIEQWEKIL